MINLRSIPRRALAGFACIYVAGLGWIAELIIPFTKLPHKIVIFSIVLVSAEALFLIGVALVGATYYKQIKAQFIERILRAIKPPADDPPK